MAIQCFQGEVQIPRERIDCHHVRIRPDKAAPQWLQMAAGDGEQRNHATLGRNDKPMARRIQRQYIRIVAKFERCLHRLQVGQ